MTTFFGVKATYFLLIYIISFSHQKYIFWKIESEITKSDLLKPLRLYYNSILWTPSLFSSILVVSGKIKIEDFVRQYINIIRIENLLNKDETVCDLYKLGDIHGPYGSYLGRCYKQEEYKEEELNALYGLSPSVPEYTQRLEEDEYNLAILKKYKHIDNQIFSFDKWKITHSLITSSFYLGDSHEDFQSNEEYIGRCAVVDEEYWGCSFKDMKFYDTVIPLTKVKNKKTSYYTIYFGSESYYIVLPLVFKDQLIQASKGKCTANNYESDLYLECEGFVPGENKFIPLKLTGDKMNMTVEIDYFYNFYGVPPKDKPTNRTRIKFANNDYIIFPMIMFKKFHVEFNNINKTISFYSNDTSILEVYKEPEPEPEPPDESDVEPPDEKKSNFGTVLLKILLASFIIVCCAGGVYLIYRYRQKCKENIEKDIQRFSKFDSNKIFASML